jgi:hypothetical protein
MYSFLPPSFLQRRPTRAHLPILWQALLLVTVLTGCADQVGWGYVNMLPHRVTIVRHAGKDQIRTTLEPFQRLEPGTGPNLPFDLVGPDGVVFAHYKPSDLTVHGQAPLSYVVIRKGSVTVEPESALQSIRKPR